MSIAPAQAGTPGIASPWPLAAASSTTRDAMVAVPTRDGYIVFDVPDGVIGRGERLAPRGDAPQRQARQGAFIAREQARIEQTVQDIQAKFAALGIKDSEGNSPVRAAFLPNFPNAAYAPDGDPQYGLPRDGIGVGIDPRSGRSFGEADDVVAHELAHRVIDHMTRAPLSMSPLSEDVAVHESLADTFAAIVDDEDPWVLGEELARPVRIMDAPERLGHPGHVRDLAEVLRPGGPHMVPVGRDRRTGEVVEAPDWHVVAGIPNKAAALIGSELGMDALGKIYINAVRNHVEPGKRVSGLASAVLRSTKELYGSDSRELQVAVDAWEAVGLVRRAAGR
jgi:hypothetical protein